jgi:putative Ca2+/H+ antiporter (TMEM165/GDT1 family)
METFLISLVVVAVGEIGDKTQLLALMLAARYRKRGAIVLGILVATLANHTLAAALGTSLHNVLPPEYLRWLIVASFLAVALWALKSDSLDSAPPASSHAGVFAVTAMSFFVAEIGDKTQIATMVLAAQFGNLLAVIAGTTAGMLLADVPAVLIGHAGADRIPYRWVRYVAAGMFAALAVVAWLAPFPS